MKGSFSAYASEKPPANSKDTSYYTGTNPLKAVSTTPPPVVSNLGSSPLNMRSRYFSFFLDESLSWHGNQMKSASSNPVSNSNSNNTTNNSIINKKTAKEILSSLTTEQLSNLVSHVIFYLNYKGSATFK